MQGHLFGRRDALAADGAAAGSPVVQRFRMEFSPRSDRNNLRLLHDPSIPDFLPARCRQNTDVAAPSPPAGVSRGEGGVGPSTETVRTPTGAGEAARSGSRADVEAAAAAAEEGRGGSRKRAREERALSPAHQEQRARLADDILTKRPSRR